MNFLCIKLVSVPCWSFIHSAFQNIFNRKTPYNCKEVKYKNRLDIFNNFGSNRKPIKIEHQIPHTTILILRSFLHIFTSFLFRKMLLYCKHFRDMLYSKFKSRHNKLVLVFHTMRYVIHVI